MVEKLEKNTTNIRRKNMKTVIVTGGSRGIGKCIAENLAKEGYNVVLNYNKSVKEAKKTKEELEKQGIKIEIYKADVSKREEVTKLIKFTLGKFGNIDVLINNAGIAKLQMFNDITDDDWNEMLGTNLNSAFFAIQEVLPNMIHNKSGCIINISSIWGMIGASCEVAYSVSKAGINGMTKALAKELGPSNIRVNAIAPGVIDTDMNSNIDEAIKEEIKNETPLNKIGKPIDIYRCVKWLIEDEFTTGQIISPNGGYVI
jgi:3-oxoacyl-[acyl-carrier protein] reductase